MEIQDLKNNLDITSVAEQLGIVVDGRTKRAKCPFHADKTPSLQFSKEKQICTCFSSNCDAGTMDVLALVERKQGLSTHEAIKELEKMANTAEITSTTPPKKEAMNIRYDQDFEVMKNTFLASPNAKKYTTSRKLDNTLLTAHGSPMGFNAIRQGKFKYLKGCVTFGLKDVQDKIVSLYGRFVTESTLSKHYYTPDRKGLYPCYPDKKTTSLILTESIIDAASLLQCKAITKDHKILALFGTNGLTAEHTVAISRLENLKEIILFFDGDDAGKAAYKKQGKYLQEFYPNIKISIVNTPEKKDINTLWVESLDMLLPLVNDAVPFEEKKGENHSLFSSSEVESLDTLLPETDNKQMETTGNGVSNLSTENPNKIGYFTETANYYIKGGIRKDLDSLKVTLVIETLNEPPEKLRCKLDLYEYKQVEKISREAAEKLGIRADLIDVDLNKMTDLLDEYRESLQDRQDEEKKVVIITPEDKEKCIEFLKEPGVMGRIGALIGKSGVVGEYDNRLFLFGIASSYKMPDTLHALIQGSSGSGKTHLLATIMDFMPPEDAISLTRVTESSLYNYGKYELQNKLIAMEDFDGLEEKAELAFRELQSKGMISSSTSGKNELTGKMASFVKEVYGPIASISATTRGEIYEDNMSRCFLVAVDESEEQTLRIIRYQNRRASGEIESSKQADIREFLRNCIRLLEPFEVVNPYASQIELPKEAHKIRRLNDLFQCYVKQVTLLNQYHRRVSEDNKLITQKEDIKTAVDIMFESIILKVDELDGSLRDFYESLKKYVEKRGREYEFIQREIRHHMKISKTQLQRYINELETLEYIQKRGQGSHGATSYKIIYWDNNEALRSRIKNELEEQIDKIKVGSI